MKRLTLILSLPFLAFGVASTTGCQGGDQPNIELVQDMFETPAIKAQEYDEDAPGHSGMRVPPEHTVPVGFKPYKYAADPERGFKENKNPIAGDESKEGLLVGMKMFETHCSVCHGLKGEGGVDGHSVVASFMALKPPSLLSEKVRGMTDGHVYHIITMGQGVMGPYASHVPQKSRWQLVNYIRYLEKSAK